MHPYIISASRREDIPAFKPDFLIKGIEKGYVDMVSPWSSYKIYFDKVKLAVFWSKNPKPLIPYLDKLPFKYYFQFTLNGYPEYELKVPSILERIETFKELSNKIGKEKIPCDARKPVAKSSESPGKKKVRGKDSKKTTTKSPM